MKHIDEQIKALSQGFEREENEIIKANLRLIKDLMEKIENSRERIYIEKIVATFCEILDIQRGIINDSDYADMIAAGYGPPDTIGYFSPTLQVSEHKSSDLQHEKLLHPYLPPIGGFQTDEQVRKAFYNYLTYHAVKETKDGRQKPFSKHTVYDYCSRIRKLWETLYQEWQDGKVERDIPAFEECILPGRTFLNAYNNIQVLQHYLMIKEVEIKRIASGLGQEFSIDKTNENPLSNPKVLGNTIAALTKFAEFKHCIVNN